MTRFAGSVFKTPNFMGERENYQGHALTGLVNRANEQSMAFQADAAVQGAGLDAQSKIEAEKFMAEATVAQGQAEGQASMFSGLAGGIGQIFGGLNFSGSSGTSAMPKPGAVSGAWTRMHGSTNPFG